MTHYIIRNDDEVKPAYLRTWTKDGWNYDQTSDRDRARAFESMTIATMVLMILALHEQGWTVEAISGTQLELQLRVW